MLIRPVKAFTLLSTGLLAGAFGYGSVNVAYAFRIVPLDVRLTFHTALMQVNGVVMQTLMAMVIISSVDLDRTLASPSDEDQLNPAYDLGDHLHLNDIGYRAAAHAVDPADLR